MRLNKKWKWAARGQDSKWYAYASKPFIGGLNSNHPFTRMDLLFDSFPECDWKESLHQIINGELVKYIGLKVNDKVMVTDDSGWVKRYFSHFSEDGTINCFVRGQNSWTTTSTIDWKRWRLPTEEELKNETK